MGAAMMHMIYDHEEHGPTNAMATTDAAKVPAMIEAWILDNCGEGDMPAGAHEQVRTLAAQHIAVVTANPPAEQRNTNLTHGWGGLKISTIPLWQG